MIQTSKPAKSTLQAVIHSQSRDGVHELHREFWYRDDRHGTTIMIPVGYTWNGASVPEVAWSVMPPRSLSIASGLVHDFLYEHGGVLPDGSVTPIRKYSRLEADRVFNDVMLKEGVPRIRRRLAYLAVRAFGADRWPEGDK